MSKKNISKNCSFPSGVTHHGVDQAKHYSHICMTKQWTKIFLINQQVTANRSLARGSADERLKTEKF